MQILSGGPELPGGRSFHLKHKDCSLGGELFFLQILGGSLPCGRGQSLTTMWYVLASPLLSVSCDWSPSSSSLPSCNQIPHLIGCCGQRSARVCSAAWRYLVWGRGSIMRSVIRYIPNTSNPKIFGFRVCDFLRTMQYFVVNLSPRFYRKPFLMTCV